MFLFNTDTAGHNLNIVASNPSVTTGGGGNLITAADLNFAGPGWRGYQGSTATITQGQATIVDSMDYLPFGE